MDKVKTILDGNHEKSDRKGHEKKKADMVSDGADGSRICGVTCGKSAEPEIQTPAACVMEVSTGEVLYEKKADEQLHPTSVTKVMTILLIFEALDAGKLKLDEGGDDKCARKIHGRFTGFSGSGEKQTVETLLKCIIIASGNDAAVAMAEHIARERGNVC